MHAGVITGFGGGGGGLGAVAMAMVEVIACCLGRGYTLHSMAVRLVHACRLHL